MKIKKFNFLVIVTLDSGIKVHVQPKKDELTIGCSWNGNQRLPRVDFIKEVKVILAPMESLTAEELKAALEAEMPHGLYQRTKVV